MGPRRPSFSQAPVAGVLGQPGPSSCERGHALAGVWGLGTVTPCQYSLAPEAQAGPSAGKTLRRPRTAGRGSCCSLLGVLTGVRTLEPGLLQPQDGRGKEPRGPRASSVVVRLQESKASA